MQSHVSKRTNINFKMNNIIFQNPLLIAQIVSELNEMYRKEFAFCQRAQ